MKKKNIIKIVKTLADSGLLLEGVTETTQNEVKKQGGFRSMLLATLSASLLGNILRGQEAIEKSQGRGVNRAGTGKRINRAGQGVLRACYGNNKMDF